MKYLYADSLDVVDPGFDFLTDSYSPGRKPYWDDAFAHELLDEPPYDGILVSRSVLGSQSIAGKYSQAQAMRFMREGGRKFLRLSDKRSEDLLLMGDCGAFNYINSYQPPYTPEEIVEFYYCAGVDSGCSVDHIIYEFSDNDSGSPNSKARQEITLELASSFFKETKSSGANFEPIGVVQGWSPSTMQRAAKDLLNMGYRYLAVGGLVPLGIKAIRAATEAIYEETSKCPGARIHLLGFAKAEYVFEFERYGVVSFDSTSPMIRSFKDRNRNYWLPNEEGMFKQYAAIRVPQSADNIYLSNRVKRGDITLAFLEKRERDALNALRHYNQGSISVDHTVEVILDYAIVMLEGGKLSEEDVHKRLERLASEYRRTLSERCWTLCDCNICDRLSIDVVIFRGSNRNKGRGMHNLHVFHNKLKSLRERPS